MTTVKLNQKEAGKRPSLQKRLNEKVAQLKATCKDAHFAAELIDDILSLKGQIDVEPTEIEVRCKDVKKEYDFDTFMFKVCNNGILFQTKGGLNTLIEPRCLSLYGSMLDLLEQYDRYNEKSKEDKELFDQYLSAWTHTLQMPVGASLSPVVLFETATTFIKKFIEVSDELLTNPLADETPEDHMQNAEQERLAEVLDSMATNVKQTDDGESEDTGIGEKEAEDE